MRCYEELQFLIQSDIYFPPEAVDDFPVTMQVSNRYKVLQMHASLKTQLL